MPFLVMIPHLFLIFYPVQECEATIEPLSRIKSDEKNELCHSQDEMTKLRGVNIDILCPGDLVKCMCHVRSTDNGELIRLTRPEQNQITNPLKLERSKEEGIISYVVVAMLTSLYIKYKTHLKEKKSDHCILLGFCHKSSLLHRSKDKNYK